MTSTSLPSPAVVEAGPPPALADAAERGRTTVSKQAMERIAALVTAECPDVSGADRRRSGVIGGRRGAEVAVAARLHASNAVSLAVRCPVPYPRPVTRATQALRDLLLDRVTELTGMTVQRVDITVSSLPTGKSRRRVR